MSAHDELLFFAMVKNPKLYEKYLDEEHESHYGPHFDEEKAREAISRLHSKNGSGELITIDQVEQDLKKAGLNIGEPNTVWDAYVAFNIWWHELGDNYACREPNDNSFCIDVVTFFFDDEIIKDGKVWKYMHNL